MGANCAEGLRRAAGVSIRCLGATCISLQVPAPPVAGDDGEQLGLSTPQFQAIAVEPAAVTQTANAVEVRVAAGVLQSALGVSGTGAVSAAMRTVSAVVVHDESFGFVKLLAVPAAGSATLYRLVLRPDATEVF